MATPFSNPTQNEPNPGKAPLKAILKLNQAKEHRIDEVINSNRIGRFNYSYPCIDPPERKYGTDHWVDANQILKEVKTYNLYFLPDDRFWDLMPETS